MKKEIPAILAMCEYMASHKNKQIGRDYLKSTIARLLKNKKPSEKE